MFYKELKTLEEKHPKQLKVFWVFSQSNEEGALFGRIDASVINFVLNQKHALPDQSFLCGPEPMILSNIEDLTNKGISKQTIHFVLYTIDYNTTASILELNATLLVIVSKLTGGNYYYYYHPYCFYYIAQHVVASNQNAPLL